MLLQTANVTKTAVTKMILLDSISWLCSEYMLYQITEINYINDLLKILEYRKQAQKEISIK